MSILEIDSRGLRRARTRSLVQLGSLTLKAGLLETFGIVLGEDLQKSPQMKKQVAALFKGLVELNEISKSDLVDFQLWATQGLEMLTNTKKR
ncbi:MAG: hypothetical protein K2P93_07600 [Alphaproteobacteria bacterium]|nr:hypothetical protein [Alphaproteobacteria bacterium]